MFAKAHFLQLRGTIFSNQTIAYNSDNTKILMDLFPNYLPTLLNVELPNGLLPIPIDQQPWKLASQDQSVNVIITGNKIDIIENIGIHYTNDKLTDFSDFCSKAFSKIINSFGLEPNRIAIAPKYALKLEDIGSLQDFASLIFKKNKFNDKLIESCSFNTVFRLSKNIGDKQDVTFNFVSTFEEGNLVEQNKDKPDRIVPCICFSFDINSYPSPDIKFNTTEITDFFTQAISWNEEFAAFYLSK